MNTTVITVESADYGAGSTDRVTFVDSSYTIDEGGSLHVFRKSEGTIASFSHGHWRSVLRGTPRSVAHVTAAVGS